jgi:Ca2+-binding RTX toxin-like protein
MAFLFGTSGNNNITGTIFDDVILGYDPVVPFPDGNDSLIGGTGNDLIYGGDGNDSLIGGTGNDTLYGGDDNDRLFGGSGNDRLFSGSGNDTLNGGSGNDFLYGNFGNDSIFGGSGNDVLYGESNNDTLNGGSGNDSIFGGSGNDSLIGGTGNDLIVGGLADDTLASGSTSDADIFRFDSLTEQTDTITDFDRFDSGAVAGDDRDIIQVRNTGFNPTGGAVDLVNGVVPANRLVRGGAALGNNAGFRYFAGNGELYFDSDGGNFNGSSLLATLANTPTFADMTGSIVVI